MTRWRDPERNEPVEIPDVQVDRDSGISLLCWCEGESFWIPKSQIHDDSEVYDAQEGKEGTLIIPRWLADEKGLI